MPVTRKAGRKRRGQAEFKTVTHSDKDLHTGERAHGSRKHHEDENKGEDNFAAEALAGCHERVQAVAAVAGLESLWEQSATTERKAE